MQLQRVLAIAAFAALAPVATAAPAAVPIAAPQTTLSVGWEDYPTGHFVTYGLGGAEETAVASMETAVVTLEVASPRPSAPGFGFGASASIPRSATAIATATASGSSLAFSTNATTLASPGPVCNDTTTPDDICSLDANDPCSWVQSGAIEYMEKWFAEHGTEDWLTKMDEARGKALDPNYDSVLHCQMLDTNLCEPPADQCSSYTEEMKVQRFIQLAAAQFEGFMVMAHEKLVDMTLGDVCDINQIIEDFAPDADPLGMNYYSVIGSSVFMAQALVGFGGLKKALVPGVTVTTSVLGIIGSSMFMKNAIDPPEEPVDNTDQWEAALGSYLGDVFESIAASTYDINSMVFGGSGSGDFDLKNLTTFMPTSAMSATEDLNPISAVFSSGIFLDQQDPLTLIDPLMESLGKIKQGMVASLFRANNYYLFIDQSDPTCARSEHAFGGVPTSGGCMITSKRGGHEETPDTVPLPEGMFRLMVSDEYGIDLNQMYQNAINCNGEKLNTNTIADDGLPHCFWSLPILSGPGSVCHYVLSDYAAAQGMPAGLQLTKDYC